MSDTDTETLAQSGAETPTAEEEQPIELPAPQDDDVDPEGGSDDDIGELEPEAEEEEIDFGGKKYKIPKELKSGFMMQSDYTRKTQEVASEREALKAERETVEQQAKAHEAYLADHAELFSIDKELKQYDNLDWQSFINDDPIGAQQHQVRMNQLRDAGLRLTQKIQKAEAERSQKAQQETAKRVEEARAELAKIPGLTEEKKAAMRAYAQSRGLDDATLNGVPSAAMMRLIYDGYVGQQLLESAKKSQATPRAAPIQPLQTVARGGRSPDRPDASRLSMDDYVKARQSGKLR